MKVVKINCIINFRSFKYSMNASFQQLLFNQEQSTFIIVKFRELQSIKGITDEMISYTTMVCAQYFGI